NQSCEAASLVLLLYFLPHINGYFCRISTVSKVMVEKGGSISIPCFYESKYTDNVKYLCKGCKWRICSYEVKTNQYNSTKYLISDDQNQGWCRTGGEGPTSCIKDSGKKDDTKVTINRNTPGVITVTMSELRERSSGWYWCTDEDLQMPVHVTIKERPTTSNCFFSAGTMSIVLKPNIY
uniref:Immunoglobulin subtype domain-containing protein n=1 Tax=Sphaeramia orbicularis TaxID=375764 RepID=A0A673CJM8_9TELE